MTMDLNEVIEELIKIRDNTIGISKIQYKDHDGYFNNINEIYLNYEAKVVLDSGD